MKNSDNWGSFTLPGEAGFEDLTLQLAEKWGADVIRDSDGTVLSPKITEAGYDIYSTICIIRDHNQWASENKDKLQQSFLMTAPVVATTDSLTICLMKDYFKEQFQINSQEDSLRYWQVFDRTENTEVPREQWTYDSNTESVVISKIKPMHKYTVNFLAFRIWEEISMYNHTTNNWDKEHLLQIDPVHEEVQNYLTDWLINWCKEHPTTNVVRFTSLFYNFAWIWGSSKQNPYLFSDWGSYDFTVSPKALDGFREKYGYSLTSEDFINMGKHMVTHIPGTKEKKDWMEYIHDFVISFGKKLIDIVHSYGKLAYVFYDDSWVGLEPYSKRFEEFGFDGIIKCVFSGYESRLCSDVKVPVHELRLHPYLFPVGLNGTPTFMEGGEPTKEAEKFWINIRRALLRAPIDRIGLGGYLHLVEPFPDFVDYIEKVAGEFRTIKKLHSEGTPLVKDLRIAVLHSWGHLRSWTLSGHFHETHVHDLIHINEALSGFPFEVDFISFEDVKKGALKNYEVIINAGYAGSAWSGGDAWKDNEIIELITRWVYEGGSFIGVNEPSATEGYDTFFRLSHLLGIDKDTGARICHGKWTFAEEESELWPDNASLKSKDGLYLTDGKARVLKAQDGNPLLTAYKFGEGNGIYLSSFSISKENNKLLLNLLLSFMKGKDKDTYISDNKNTECTYFPASKTLCLINNSDTAQVTSVTTDFGVITAELGPADIQIMTLA